MITINGVFKGKHDNLEMFLFTGLKDYSSKMLAINTLKVIWISHELDYEKALQDCMGLVDMRKVEFWDIEINFIK